MQREILELFDEAQGLSGDRLTRKEWVACYRVVDVDSKLRRQREHAEYDKRSSDRRAYKAKWMREQEYLKVKKRLLAGDRPKSGKGKKGRPPKLWLLAAKELGIELEAA